MTILDALLGAVIDWEKKAILKLLGDIYAATDLIDIESLAKSRVRWGLTRSSPMQEKRDIISELVQSLIKKLEEDDEDDEDDEED